MQLLVVFKKNTELNIFTVQGNTKKTDKKGFSKMFLKIEFCEMKLKESGKVTDLKSSDD